MDKTEIMDLARQIGTYELSIQNAHSCPFLPDRPLTQGTVSKLRELLEKMEGAEDGQEPPGIENTWSSQRNG
jgi:thiamine biosynthesis protein ThiI